MLRGKIFFQYSVYPAKQKTFPFLFMGAYIEKKSESPLSAITNRNLHKKANRSIVDYRKKVISRPVKDLSPFYTEGDRHPRKKVFCISRISITARSLYLSEKSVKSRKESSLTLTVPLKLNFGLPRLVLPNAGQSGVPALVLAKPALIGDQLLRKRGESTPFWARPPIFCGRELGSGPNSPNFIKSALILPLNLRLGGKPRKKGMDSADEPGFHRPVAEYLGSFPRIGNRGVNHTGKPDNF